MIDWFFFVKIFIPNKCTFKKFIQSINASCNLSLESDTFKTKIEDIKTKIKSTTKNNELIHDELDYLFDQRCANLEPAYEKISLIDLHPVNTNNISLNDEKNIFKMQHSIDEEFIDLTNVNRSGCCLQENKKTIASKTKKFNSKIKFDSIKGSVQINGF